SAALQSLAASPENRTAFQSATIIGTRCAARRNTNLWAGPLVRFGESTVGGIHDRRHKCPCERWNFTAQRGALRLEQRSDEERMNIRGEFGAADLAGFVKRGEAKALALERGAMFGRRPVVAPVAFGRGVGVIRGANQAAGRKAQRVGFLDQR